MFRAEPCGLSDKGFDLPFYRRQMSVLEKRVDQKIAEIEKRLDEQIQKELRIKLRILIYTLLTIILASLLSLGYFYIKKVLSI